MDDLIKQLKRYDTQSVRKAQRMKEAEKAESNIPTEEDIIVPTGELIDIFEEIPQDLNTFLYDKVYLGLEGLSDEQYKFVEHGSQIYYPETMEMLGWEPVRYVGELIAQWGKGSGKDFCSAILTARIVYLMLCLKTPLTYFQQSRLSHIDILNMAYSGEQAESNFFDYFRDMILTSKWFRGKYKLKAARVDFAKKIRAFSGNSFEESFEGKNLMVCVLDEIAAFKTNDEIESMRKRRQRAPRYSAEAVYDMAGTSITSRFPRGIGKLISISFPRYKGDFIQQLYRRYKDEETVYVTFGATWEINPRRKRKDFDDEYRKNPERAQGRYECKPSEKLEAFFTKQELIDEVFRHITEEECPTTDEMFPKLKPWVKCLHGVSCSVHVDLGWKFCSAGIALAHCTEAIREGDAELPVIDVDIITSFIAPPNGEIDFEEIRLFILKLRDVGFNIAVVTFDGYQSVYFMQMFNKMGIESKLRSVDRTPDAYEDLKNVIYTKRLTGYFAPRHIMLGGNIEEKFILRDELRNLVGLGDGHAPDKRAGGIGKDEADAVAGAVQGAIELGYSGAAKSSDVELGKERETYAEREGMGADREYLTPLTDL